MVILLYHGNFLILELGGRAIPFVGAADGRHLCILALNRVIVVAVTTTLVLHVAVIGHHVPCHQDFMFPRCSCHARLRARGVGKDCPSGGPSGDAFAPPGR